MGISERKERQKAELRGTILAAARRIFVQEGAEALTMRRIADAIEYSPGTIYLYFASREEIALQLVAEGFEKLLDAFGPALQADDPVERIRAIGRAYIAFGLDDPETYKLIFMENAKFVYSVLTPSDATGSGQPGQRAFDVLSEAIRDAIARGQFKAVDPERAAEAFWAAVHGVLSLHITCPQMIGDVAGVAAILQDALVAGLRFETPPDVPGATPPDGPGETSSDVRAETSSDVRGETSPDVRAETSSDVRAETSSDVRGETSPDVRSETSSDVTDERAIGLPGERRSG